MANIVRFIHAADIHLGNVQYNLFERFKDFNKSFQWLLNQTIERKADFLLISGDFFHHNDVKPDTMSMVFQLMQTFKETTENKVPIIVIEGNHDLRRYGTIRSWLEFMAEINLIVLLDANFPNDSTLVFKEYNFNTHQGGFINIKGVNIYGLKWQGSAIKDYFTLIEQSIQTTGCNVLMLHFGIKGYINDRNDGIDYDQHLTVLKNKVDYLALGHYHKKYDIDNWIFNPGSLESCEFQEYENDRGIFFVEVIDNKIDPNNVKFISIKDNNRKFLIRNLNIGINNLPDFVIAKQYIINNVNKMLKIRENKDQKTDSSDLSIPILQIILEGTLPYKREEMDIESLRTEIEQNYQVLHVRVQNNCTSKDEGMFIEDDELVNISNIEAKSFSHLIETDVLYKESLSSIVDLMKDIKFYLIGKKKEASGIANLIEDWWEKNEMDKLMEKNRSSPIKNTPIEVSAKSEDKISVKSKDFEPQKNDFSEKKVEIAKKTKKSKSTIKKKTLDDMLSPRGGD